MSNDRFVALWFVFFFGTLGVLGLALAYAEHGC